MVGRESLPRVSFILPTLNAGKMLNGCLERIRSQDYPQDLVEILIIDGGSVDDTLEIATRYRCTTIRNEKRLTGPGLAMGFQKATGAVNIFFSADNWLPHRRWLRTLVTPFISDPTVVGSFGPFIVDRKDGSLNRYFSWVESTPYHYFLCRNESSKKLYRNSYRLIEDKGAYRIWDMTVEKFPILGLGNGFALNRLRIESDGRGLKELIEKALAEDLDDILPVIKMLESGFRIAYVPDGGIIHYHLENYRQFIEKYAWKIRNNILGGLAYTNARMYLSRKRRVREKMWLLYGLTIIGPLVDTATGIARDRDAAWLHHPLSCLLLTLITGLTILTHPRSSIKYFFSLHRPG